jgi:hypothetical protein
MYGCSVVLMAVCLKSRRRLYWCRLWDAAPDPSSGEPPPVSHAECSMSTAPLLQAPCSLVAGAADARDGTWRTLQAFQRILSDERIALDVEYSPITRQMHLCAHVLVETKKPTPFTIQQTPPCIRCPCLWHGLATGFSVPWHRTWVND